MARTRKRESSDKETAGPGGAPHAPASAYAQGRRAGFVDGFCSALNQGIHWAEALAPGSGKEVADKLLPHLERMYPDAEKMSPVLAKLREGIPYDEPAPAEPEAPADEPTPEEAEAPG